MCCLLLLYSTYTLYCTANFREMTLKVTKNKKKPRKGALLLKKFFAKHLISKGSSTFHTSEGHR